MQGGGLSLQWSQRGVEKEAKVSSAAPGAGTHRHRKGGCGIVPGTAWLRIA